MRVMFSMNLDELDQKRRIHAKTQRKLRDLSLNLSVFA